MLKRLGFSTLALATALAVAAPAVSLARDRDDFRRDNNRHERYEHRDNRYDKDRNRTGFSVSFGYNTAPARRVVNGYNDRYGKWHAVRGYYDQRGNFCPF